MTTWKHAERQIAKRLGGRRVPVPVELANRISLTRGFQSR
jgi:hypothetical protein